MLRWPALAFAVACLGASASAEIQWGVNGHPINAYPGIAIEDQVDLLKELGLTSYRVDISLIDQADQLETILDVAKQRGIEILPVLTPGGIDRANDPVETIYQKAYDFAFALGKRFGDDVRVWELGNEEENYAIIQPCELREDGTQYPCEWGPAAGIDALEYFGPRWDRVSALLSGLSDGINSAVPDAITAMGTAGWGHVGAFELMKRDNIDWDISVWHMYGEDPEWAFQIIKDYDRPIWVTELNNPRGSEDGQAAQAQGLSAIMTRLVELAERYRIEAVHIYELLDEPYWAPGFEAVMGLLTMVPTAEGGWTVGSPKQAYQAVRNIIGCDAQRGGSSAEQQVNYAYCLVLGVKPPEEQLEKWRDALERGDASPTDMLAAALESDAFRSRYQPDTLDEREYVTLMYRLLLGREPDGYGLNSYSEQIETGAISRREFAAGTIVSDEFIQKHEIFSQIKPEQIQEARCDKISLPTNISHAERSVAYANCLLLGEQMLPPEQGWVEDIRVGRATLVDYIDSIVQSHLFLERNHMGDLTNAEYVASLYRVLVGREPDGQGLDAYVAQLDANVLSRASLASALVRSGEFVDRHPLLAAPENDGAPQRECDLSGAAGVEDKAKRQVIYAHCLILGKAPDIPTLQHWSDALSQGQSTTGDLLVSLVRSEAFSARYASEDLSDPEFVRLVYMLLLDREPDGAGMEEFARQLAEGSLDREGMALGALWSSEFSERHEALAN